MLPNVLPLLALAFPVIPDGATSPAADAPTPVAIELAFQPVKDWRVLLPAEQFAPIGKGIAFPHAEGGAFAVRLEGTVLWVDRDGDGECEAKVEPLEPGKTALLVLRAPTTDGAARSYAVRLSSANNWSYSTSGAMVGEYQGTRLRLIDQNNNGRFDDLGEDALIVGPGSAASFLSQVIRIGDELHSIQVAADGTHLEGTPYTGEVGRIDFGVDHESKARMRAVVIQSTDGKYSFEVSQARGNIAVPAGEYLLHSGQVALGSARAELRQGRFAAVTVAPGETSVVPWGGPVQAEFRYHRQGNEVVIAPNEIWYFGRAGEEYSSFLPLGSSPKFFVKDRKTGEVLVTAQFPGST